MDRSYIEVISKKYRVYIEEMSMLIGHVLPGSMNYFLVAGKLTPVKPGAARLTSDPGSHHLPACR
jgi:hypothetical protein